MTAPIWLLGCGNMGGALLRRWLADEMGPVAVIDPAPRDIPDGVPVSAVPPGGHPDVLVLAVKPQLWREAAAPLTAIVGPLTLVVSVMAGVTTADIACLFPQSAIVRAMPNTPAGIGMGVTALFTAAGDLAEGAAEALFSPAGTTVWLDNEEQFDAVTAVSGSGPGYVFAFIEALAAALRRLADDEVLRREMGLNGKRVVDDVFQFERFVAVQGEHLAMHFGLPAGRAREAA